MMRADQHSVGEGSLTYSARTESDDCRPGNTPVPGVGESVSLSRTSSERTFQRDAETNAREERAPRPEEVHYAKRRLPHFEKPWATYAVTISTRARRTLSPTARTIVLNALKHFHLNRYELFAGCVMPDHIHFLFQPWPKENDDNGNASFWSLAELLHSVKSFTSHKINELDKVAGPLWEEESFDRFIRSETDLAEKFRYICRNPWSAGIVASTEDYPWLWTWQDDSRLGSTPVSGVGFGVSPKQSFSEVRESETLSPTPETGVLPGAEVSRARSSTSRIRNKLT